MAQFHDHRFPGESDDYRAARDRLLAAEKELRRQAAEVAARRRELPAGGRLAKDYVFEEIPDPSASENVRQIRFSEFFEAGKDSLVIYSFMYAPDAEVPCPMCTSMLDGLDGNAPHISQRVNLAVVAKAPIGKVRQWAADRGWRHLRLLSSAGNTYSADYFAEGPDGGLLDRPLCRGVLHRGRTDRHQVTVVAELLESA